MAIVNLPPQKETPPRNNGEKKALLRETNG